MLDAQQLRQQILPILETSGLIYQEQDPSDKRKVLIFPVIHCDSAKQEEYSGDEGGVDLPEDKQMSLDNF